MKATPCIGQVSKPIDFKELATTFVLRVIKFYESSIMKLATSPCLKIFVSLSFSKPVISFDNRLETVRLSSQG